MMADLICPECGATMILRRYKYGPFYGCSKYPDCQTTHGVHPDGVTPLGTPGDRETRSLRIQVHEAFDPMWQCGTFTRKQAYRILGCLMDLEVKETHIGKFTKEQCREALKKLKGD